MKYKKALAAACFSALMVGGNAYAELTPMGAEAAGNADGSIPAWNSAGVTPPASFVAGSGTYPNPYADEKPILTIDASNWQQHADNLTEGTKGLFEKLGADGFKMLVYPTHRDSVAPDWLYENNKKNDTVAKLVEDGLKVEGNLPGVPFMTPESGSEALWNHMVRYMTDHDVDYSTYYVGSDGKPVLSTIGKMSNVFPAFREENRNSAIKDTPWFKLRINYTAPARRAGEILLVHEPGADYTEGRGRKAWQYLTGQRRVRLAPAVSFDTPNPGVAGTTTYDDSFIFNGSQERYTWKLVGKKEMYIPYNNYDFVFGVEAKDTLGPKFLDPEVIRWEKHRVWIVEGDLKEGKRHLYSKRRYYLDEDTWSAVTGDTYDGRGNLWRVHYAYIVDLYDIKSRYDLSYGAYDLLQGLYNINTKPQIGGFKNGVDQGDRYWTSKGMARGGVR